MKEKLLIVGSGGFGRVVSEHARKQYECAFIDDGVEGGREICDLKVIGKVSALTDLFSQYKLLVVAIGNNKTRERIYQEAKQIGYRFPNIACNSVYISSYASIGNGCIFLNNVIIQNNSHVGDGVILMPNIEIHHDANIGDYSLIYANSVVRSLARVGNRVKIGSTTTISTSSVVPDDTIIDDGSVYKTEE